MNARLRIVLIAALALPLVAGAEPARAADECEGLMVCISVPGPWVVVPASSGSSRAPVRYQLTCPRGYIVGGTDAELSNRALEVAFVGRLGSPVNPGISTARSVVFVASYVGRGARAPTFKPYIGCMPATGGGIRVPTAVTQLPNGEPTTFRARTVRVRPGSATITQACTGRERLVGASHAVGFFGRRPPSASLVATVSASRRTGGARVVVRARGNAELGGVRAVVQAQAVCARAQ